MTDLKGADVVFVASAPRNARANWPPTPQLRRRRGRLAGRAPARPDVDRGEIHRARSAPPPASPSAWPDRARPRGRVEPGVPARGPRRRRHPAPRPARLRRSPCATAPRRCCGEVYARRSPPAPRSSSPICATAELVKVAANSFLATKISFINAMAEVCEAAGADVDDPRRRHRPRRPHRPQVPQRRPRLRRGLPAQGHPRVHGPRRRARRRPGADLPARGRRHQHAPPVQGRRAGPRGLRRVVHRARGSPCSAPRSSRTATTSATRPALNVAAQASLQGADVVVTDPAALDNAQAHWPDLSYAATRRGGRDRAPTWCCWPPSGPSTPAWTPRPLP